MANAKTQQPAHPRFKRLPKGPHGGVELLLMKKESRFVTTRAQLRAQYRPANNYLIPQGLATLATEHHKRMVDKHRARLLEIERKRLSGLESLAAEIGKQSVTIEANANDEGHLYGSVGAADIVAALKQAGITITTDQVRLEGLLKESLVYTVKMKKHASITTDLMIWMVTTAADDDGK